VETRAKSAANEIDDFTRDSGGEHHVLALNNFRVRKVLLDVLNLLGETSVEKTISLVHDERIEVRGSHARVGVRENIKQTARGADKNVAALALCLLQHHALLGATDGTLDNEAGAGSDLLRLNSNLFGQLSRRGNDDGADVVGLGPLVAAGPLAELRIGLHDALDNGDEETQRLARSGLGLGNAAEGQLCCVLLRQSATHTSTPLRASLMVRV
jgi:hypothetical protein